MDSSVDWPTRLDELVAKSEQRLIEIRRHLHANPEPSGHETETSQFVAEQLLAAGMEPHVFRNGIGVFADLQIGRISAATPLIAIRADMDALRMNDEKLVPYASQKPGLAHACGHDAHTTITLGAACAASALRQQFTQTEPPDGLRLRFLFQPAEETSEGAQWMIEQGALDGVSAILALHVDPERTVGTVGVRHGVLTANCDEVDILIEGHGGHGARPHHSIDPIAASAQLITAFYQLLPRSVDSRLASVFTIGQINGGYAPNVIPEQVSLRGSLRTIDADCRETLKRRIEEIADGVRQMTGVRIQIHFLSPLRSVDNSPHVTPSLELAARDVVGFDHVTIIDRPSMGGEDFAAYLDHVPGAMLRLGCAAPGVEKAPFLHSARFDIDERALAIGARVLLRTACLLTQRFSR